MPKLILMFLLLQIVSVLEAAPLINQITERHDDDIDMLPGLYNDWMDNQNQSVIMMYSRLKNKWITYDMMHTYWASKFANNYTLYLNKDKQLVVKLIQKVYWTLDESTIANNIRIIAVKEQSNTTILPTTFPLFIDVTYVLNVEDRLRVIRNTLQDAFASWSSVLYDRLVFEYIPYTAHLKNLSSTRPVIITRMGARDENVTDKFAMPDPLARSWINALYFNTHTAKFYIAPHLTSKRIYIVTGRDSLHGTTLREMSSEALARRYNMTNYRHLYRQSKMLIYHLAGMYRTASRIDSVHWCLECVAFHEIGHLIGLGHSNSHDSAMYGPDISNEVIASEDDQYMVKKIYAQFLRSIENITKLKICTHNIE